jgi:aspartate 1-decarboxylase
MWPVSKVQTTEIMYRKFLRSKIHRATVTQADLDYEGSLTLPPSLLRAADILPYEAVQVWNVTRGSRLETYAIEGEEGSSEICANGAAAHLIRPGDLVIVATFSFVAEIAGETPSIDPKVVFVDSANKILRVGKEIAGPRRRGVPANTADSCC